MADFFILSGGAAQGLVGRLQEPFEADSGDHVKATFGAVGAMQKLLGEGAACDLLILTKTLVTQLAKEGKVLADSITDLGLVKTGIAVKQGASLPRVGDAKTLRTALLAADAIYLPDPVLATAGIHFQKVLQQLGIADTVAARLRPFPNGNAAMRAMAQSKDKRPIGCTQVTEILITAGVQLVANLPAQYELATVYTAAVPVNTRREASARLRAQLLAAPTHAALRLESGFLALA